MIENINGFEALRVGVLKVIQLSLKKYVVLGKVAEYECYFGFVFGVLKDSADELVPIHNRMRMGVFFVSGCVFCVSLT